MNAHVLKPNEEINSIILDGLEKYVATFICILTFF